MAVDVIHFDGMTLNDFQRESFGTAVYPGQGTPDGLEYTLFGMLGEAGEVANKHKKILRNRENPYDHKEMYLDELGDVLWYVNAALKELGYTMQDMADYNLRKLAARQAAGTLKKHE